MGCEMLDKFDVILEKLLQWLKQEHQTDSQVNLMAKIKHSECKYVLLYDS